jgi:hypothetical protein
LIRSWHTFPKICRWFLHFCISYVRVFVYLKTQLFKIFFIGYTIVLMWSMYLAQDCSLGRFEGRTPLYKWFSPYLMASLWFCRGCQSGHSSVPGD